MHSQFDESRSSRPVLTAEGARSLTKKRTDNNNRNFEIMLKRIYKMIETRAADGCDELEYNMPSFILDGTICDPIVLAAKIQHKLISLGYDVQRTNSTIFISWKA